LQLLLIIPGAGNPLPGNLLNFAALSFYMKTILVIGAGRSTSYLVDYLIENASKENWSLRLADVDVNLAKARIGGREGASALAFDVKNEKQRREEISKTDLVISMLPAFMHGEVAKDCVQYKKHLSTASYVSAEMKVLHEDAKKAGIVLMNEVGLDPGIDHASAMKIIDEIHSAGGEVEVFKSYCGGLVAPESNDNPWGYKFSWNPRNVILAGQGTAQFFENGELKFIPYNRIFSQTEIINVEGCGSFDGYANRDSVSYREPYGLKSIKTLLRGTLRATGYCRAWNVFVQLGLTDDSWKLPSWGKISWPALLNSFLPGKGDIKKRLLGFSEVSDKETIAKLEWLGIFDEKNELEISGRSPAEVLQSWLEKKWLLKSGDKDMIVMQHIFEYVIEGNKKALTSSLVVKGENETHTAMAKTVGLPLAIASKMILCNQFSQRGVVIPTTKDIYLPLLEELKKYGIDFVERELEAAGK
jgi:saccharopine dehydrogenase-like NADP-dependent oxidoreductase